MISTTEKTYLRIALAVLMLLACAQAAEPLLVPEESFESAESAVDGSVDESVRAEAEAVVRRLYLKFLAREPDPRELHNHTEQLLEEDKDEAWLARTLRSSNDGRKIRRCRRQTVIGVIGVFFGSLLFLFAIWRMKERRCSSWKVALVYTAWCVLLLETVIRLYFTSVIREHFFRPERALHAMLLSKYAVSTEQYDPGMFKAPASCRVLLLGGSVVDRNHGRVPHLVRDRLKDLGAEDVHLFNYARAAHTTRDSRFKYLRLCKDAPFDIVAVYHAINEVRANNCPDDVFREDYGHYAWYEDVNIAERHMEWVRYTTIPYMADYLYHRARQWLTPRRYMPIDKPPPDWLVHAEKIKTVPSFRRNLEVIIQTARSRSATVLLMTFAYYVPPDYSEEAFWQQKLDYSKGRGYPIELWGKPEHVVSGIDAHNQVIRDLAAENPDVVVLLDMEQLIPGQGFHFRDICHFSYEGCELMAEILAERLVELCAR